MSSDIQLVLIGGIIAIASSVVTTVLASLLGYLLENRREKRRLKLEYKKTVAFNALLLAEANGFNIDALEALAKGDDKDRDDEIEALTLDQLAAWVGGQEAMVQVVNRKRERKEEYAQSLREIKPRDLKK